MDTQTFKEFISKNQRKLMKLMESPKKKRASDDDRFSNFRRMAEMEQVPAAYVALSKCNKQFIDIMDILQFTDPEEVDMKYLQELINDVHIYLNFALGIASEDSGKDI